MFETTRYETRRRVKGTVALTLVVSLYTAFIVWYYAALPDVDYEELFADMPPAMIEAFGIDALGTIEGFLAVQIFNFVWLLALGLYFAYAAAGLVASEMESGGIDLLVSFPLSRTQLLLEKFATLLLPLVTLNVVVGTLMYAMIVAIGESIDPVHLALVFLLSIPYLLVCAAIGLVFSVSVSRTSIAERGAVGVLFLLYLVDAVVAGGTDYEWMQYVSPTNYYEPTPLLVDGSYELLDIGVLIGLFMVLLLCATVLFRRRDL